MKPLLTIVAAAAILTGPAAADEPVLGGPCEGCELVFVGLPADLTRRGDIAPDTEPGERMVIEGTVLTADGAPAAGIILYAYQTDAGGIYPAAETRHGRLRGWAKTDAQGAYRFDTIRPGSYPSRNAPEHVHMHVIEPGVGTYYIDDIVFTDDPLLTRKYVEQQSGRGGDGVAEPVRDASGTWRVTRDVVLGKNIPGYE